MQNNNGITQYFGTELAKLLSSKIISVYKAFPKEAYIKDVDNQVDLLTYSKRIDLHADLLKRYLPDDYLLALDILINILGEENPNETGMFTEFYWILPIGKYVEKYGLSHFDASIKAIEAITKRNTGEYAIRPYIRAYPHKTLDVMLTWATSDNFHLRRLASEGLRPKLPWATKLETFINDPDKVFQVLERLKEDDVMFVKKSVANHLTDWLKVNQEPTIKLINQWKLSHNKHTAWIIKRATRHMDQIT